MTGTGPFDLEHINLRELTEVFKNFGTRILTKETVKEKAGAKESFAGAILMDLDLTGMDFSGMDLSQAMILKTCLKGADFKGANLSATQFSEADLDGAVFEKADLSQAKIVNTMARGADFRGADLSSLSVAVAMRIAKDPARMALSEKARALVQRDPAGKNWADLDLGLEDLGLSDQDIVMGESCFDGADFTGSHLVRARFESVGLANACFTGADLSLTFFGNCRMTGARLDHTRLWKAGFDKTGLGAAVFEGAVIQEAR
ncbi:MAG: pentapeptide repeat-containing protein, partial [Desulfobacteraceae bacterium]|nr:pentapeptide repeat-containing protein [Desulfobacteraceae bacterium]